MTRSLRGHFSLISLCALTACARHAAPVAASAGPAEAADSAAPPYAGPPEVPPADSIVGPPRRVERAEIPPRSNSDLVREPDLNQALTDVRRLGIVSGYQEVRRGLLRLAVGPRFRRGSSVVYNFGRLRMAYRKSIEYYGDGVLEIWGDGRKLGEYTVDGLFLGPEYADPR
jgi:hypothetical protein